MIEGFRLRFTSDELRAHLRGRAEHHDERAATKEAEIVPLRDIADKIKPPTDAPANAAGKFSNTRSHTDVHDAISSLEDQIREHRSKAVVFRLFAEHLFAEDYDLQENDLVRLEMLKR